MFGFLFQKSNKPTTKFSRFFHEASSADRKKAFLQAARKATKDQEKLIKA